MSLSATSLNLSLGSIRASLSKLSYDVPCGHFRSLIRSSSKEILYYSRVRALTTASLEILIVSMLYPPSNTTMTLSQIRFIPSVIQAYPTGVTPIPPRGSLTPESKPQDIKISSGSNSLRIGKRTWEHA